MKLTCTKCRRKVTVTTNGFCGPCFEMKYPCRSCTELREQNKELVAAIEAAEGLAIQLYGDTGEQTETLTALIAGLQVALMNVKCPAKKGA